MISRIDLIKNIETAMRLEEEVIPLYVKHCEIAASFTIYDPHLIQKTKEVLAKLGKDSQNHRRWLISMLIKLEKESRDAF